MARTVNLRIVLYDGDDPYPEQNLRTTITKMSELFDVFAEAYGWSGYVINDDRTVWIIQWFCESCRMRFTTESNTTDGVKAACPECRDVLFHPDGWYIKRKDTIDAPDPRD